MTPGSILFHKNFVFADGSAAHKYLVVLAATATHLLIAKTTSNGTRYRNDHGCQAGNYFAAFLLTAGCCCLPKNTWICFGEFYELEVNAVRQRVVAGEVRQYGKFDAELTKDVLVCAANTDDITGLQEKQIRAHL